MIASILALFPIIALAVAQQCNTGDIVCCNSTSTYSNAASYLEQEGIVSVFADVDALVGLSCSGISVVGTSSGCNANQEPLCCEDNTYNGLVSIGCTPINVIV